MRVLIFDPLTARPYDDASLAREPLGGTEATVIRVARAIDAQVMQYHRASPSGRYIPIDGGVKPTHVISLRHPGAAVAMRAEFPDAVHVLWMHDLMGPDLATAFRKYGRELARTETVAVCVSDFHVGHVRQALNELLPGSPPLELRRVYNPIDEDLAPDGTGFDGNTLIYFSSPNKGLQIALQTFAVMHEREPSLRLKVANPGYFAMPDITAEGITVLGSLPHGEVKTHVRTALASFIPNFVYPETFGLVLAESNALGTPVIAHPYGAAAEVLGDPRQIVPLPVDRSATTLAGLYLSRIEEWRNGHRPAVVARPEFRTGNVAAAWLALLAELDERRVGASPECHILRAN